MLIACLLVTNACGRTVRETAPLPPLDAPPPAGATRPTDEYRLQPGDLVRIKYLYHPELDIRLPVQPDGKLVLQVAGQVHAAGLTTFELAKTLEQRSGDRLREPEVAVAVAQAADSKIYVGGEVKVPGFVVFHEGMTPLQAIIARGGFTNTARLDSVLRISSAQPEYQGTRLDFEGVIADGAPEGVVLAAGDVIYVPRSFIGDVNTFVRLYIREVLPIQPRIGAGTQF